MNKLSVVLAFGLNPKLFWVENVMDLDIHVFIQPGCEIDVNNLPRKLVKVIPLQFTGDLLSFFL